MHGKLIVVPDRQHAPRKSSRRHKAIEQAEYRMQPAFDISGRRLQRHRIRRHAQAIAALHRSGHGHGNLSLPCHLPEKRARRRALRHVIRRKFREPGLRVLEIARSSTGCRNAITTVGFPAAINLIHECPLLLGKTYVALAISHAHE